MFSPVRDIQIWIDGKKKAEGFNSYGDYSFLKSSIALAAGAHRATIFSAGYDERLQKKTFTFTVK